MENKEPTPIIGDYVVSTDYLDKVVPVGIPVKIIGLESDPDPNTSNWNGLPEEIMKSGDPFYVVEFPDFASDGMVIGFVKMENTKPYTHEQVNEEPMQLQEQQEDDFYNNDDFFKHD